MIAHNTAAAIDFLRALAPSGYWLLSAIDPLKTGVIETMTFTVTTARAAEAWINSWQGKRNLYFSVNQPRRVMTIKATKNDISAMVALHVDIDPAPPREDCTDVPAHYASERRHILAKLQAYSPAASVIIDSGGGYQGLWLFKEPVDVEGKEEIERLEAYNRKLEKDLGGDHCFNIDRILRLPGTVNLPNAKKLKAGRLQALATLASADWALGFDLGQFAAGKPESPSQGKEPQEKAVSGPRRRDLPSRTTDLIRDGAPPGSDRSRLVLGVCCEMVRCGRSDEEIVEVLLDRTNRISDHVQAQPKPSAYAARQAERAREKVATERPLLNPSAPLGIAKLFAHRPDGRPLRHHGNGFYEWRGSHYRQRSIADIESMLYEFLESATRKRGEKISPFNPARADIEKVLHALRSHVHLWSEITPPAWLTGKETEPFMACANGLLRLSDMTLQPHTADYFNTSAVDFDYDPTAPEPAAWLKFLDDLWGNDREAIDALQDMMGYIVSGERQQQKMFLLVGPPRSGKGTIGHVLKTLVGAGGTVGPTLASLTKQFGLAPLIDKTLAVIPDARIQGSTHEVVERLLAVSGGDTQSIDRKNREAYTCVLPTRLVFLTNEVPALLDNSGALASRFIVWEFTESFLGREDKELGQKLAQEMPAILNWSLIGWQRLKRRGHFIEPASGRMSREILDQMASPILAFLHDRCELEPSYTIRTKVLYQAWRDWCLGEAGRDHPGTEQSFGRNLHAAQPKIKTKRRQQTLLGDVERVHFYNGVRLRDGYPVAQAAPRAFDGAAAAAERGPPDRWET